MAQVIGNVKSFESGTFFVKESSGEVRQLKNGDLIYEGDQVYGAPDNLQAAKIVIDVILPSMGDVVLGGSGMLTFDNSVLAEMFSQNDAIVYVNSVKEAFASVASSDAATDKEITDAGETAAGDAVTDTERAGDVFATRTGTVGEVSTSLNSTDPTILSGVQIPGENPIVLKAGAVNTSPIGNNDNAVGSQNDGLTTPEDTALTIDPNTLLANDIDPDGDTLIITSVQGAVNGTVALVGGNIVFTPDENYYGEGASFTYTVSDGNGGTSTATVNVNVTSVNDLPVGKGTQIVTSEDTSITGALPVAKDDDGDTVTYALDTAGLPSNGTVVINPDGTYTYTPDKNYSGTDSFLYSVSDGQGGSNTYEVNITVNPVSDAPGLNASFEIGEDSLVTVYSDATLYNLHTHNPTTGVIALGEDATSALISLKSYKVGVDDGIIILMHNGEPVASILIDDVYPYLHNKDIVVSVDAGGVLFDSIMINNYVTDDNINSEFKIESINASVSNYEYTLNITDIYLTDNELLGSSVRISGLPAGIELTNGVDFVLVDENGIAYLDAEPDAWTMTLNHELPIDTNIIATLTSTDGDSVSAITSVSVYGDNDLVGGDGNDLLVGDLHTIGSTLYGDTVDGGDGSDTLVLVDGGNIDFGVLNTANNSITNIEIIDLSVQGDHNLQNISYQDIVDMTGGGNILTILGDSATDMVSVDSTMSHTGTSTEIINGVTYDFDIYSSVSGIDPTVTLRVENVITDTIA